MTDEAGKARARRLGTRRAVLVGAGAWGVLALAWFESFRQVDSFALDVGRASVCVWSHYGFLSAYASWNRYDGPQWSARHWRERADTLSPSGLVWHQYTAHWDGLVYSEPTGYRVISATVPFWLVGTLSTIGVLLLWRRKRPARAGFCACGYDLRGGHASGRCPECGVAIATPPPPPVG